MKSVIKNRGQKTHRFFDAKSGNLDRFWDTKSTKFASAPIFKNWCFTIVKPTFLRSEAPQKPRFSSLEMHARKRLPKNIDFR